MDSSKRFMKKPLSKQIIDSIQQQSITKMNRFGVEIAPILFRKQDFAICLSKQEGLVEFLLPKVCDNWTYKFKSVTLLISMLKLLEFKGLIYVVTHEIDDFSFLYYESVTDFKQATDGIKINDDETLCEGSDGGHVIQCNGTDGLYTKFSTPVIYRDIIYYLNSYILPTAALDEYVSHGYRFDEDYRSFKSDRISKWSIAVAITIAVVSMIVSISTNQKGTVVNIFKLEYPQIKTEQKCDTISTTSGLKTAPRPYK